MRKTSEQLAPRRPIALLADWSSDLTQPLPASERLWTGSTSGWPSVASKATY